MGQTVQIRIDQTGSATSTTRVRGHRISVDRPLEKGGEDRGPMGGELILVGLGGCFTSNLLAAIRARQAPVSRVSTTVTATLAERPSRFAAIDLAVSADCNDDALLLKLVTIAERACIAANTLRGGVRLSVRVTLTEPAADLPRPTTPDPIVGAPLVGAQ